jgi:hypothetical protein
LGPNQTNVFLTFDPKPDNVFLTFDPKPDNVFLTFDLKPDNVFLTFDHKPDKCFFDPETNKQPHLIFFVRPSLQSRELSKVKKKIETIIALRKIFVKRNFFQTNMQASDSP